MRILVIKTSSMGDVIHTLPALTDAGRAIPDIRFDWVVEESFTEIPRWHPLVDRVIPVAIRRWRKNLFSKKTYSDFTDFYKLLRGERYDVIIDAQGLFKSLGIAHLAKGKLSTGMDWSSARESWVSLFYTRKCKASWDLHAVTRLRQLFSQSLGYALPNSMADYGVDKSLLIGSEPLPNYIVMLHGTTWTTKHWPEEYWCELAKMANKNEFAVKLLWGNEAERERAERIAARCENAEVMPRLGLVEIAKVLAGAKAIVAVDTGLGHLAAALDVPTVSLYGPTNPVLTGAVGRSQVHLAASFPCAPCLSRKCKIADEAYAQKPPCFTTLPPKLVWETVSQLFEKLI
jgi:heptosyltransferase-1